MGSKRAMLANGLGEVLSREISDHARRRGDRSARFVDLFTGTGSVAAYVAEQARVRAYATDLQLFATVLAGAVIGRNRPVDAVRIWAKWSVRAQTWMDRHPGYRSGVEQLKASLKTSPETVAQLAQQWASGRDESLLRAYVGHYFGPLQGLQIVALRNTLPSAEPDRTVCLAALISASSACSASPGHTAEPFRASGPGGRYVLAAWRRDVFELVFTTLNRLAPRHAQRIGSTAIGEASAIVEGVTENDLVFLDPPYSAVQYSRFYHVLESVARGTCGEVDGRGRYPPIVERPQSQFSNTTTAADAMRQVLERVADRGARALVTFPSGRASNGLSGSRLRKIADEFFHVHDSQISGSFSTMGGKPMKSAVGKRAKPGHRPARAKSRELLLVLKPR